MVTHKDVQAAVDQLIDEICPKLAALVDKFFPDGRLPHKDRTVFPGEDPPDPEEELRAGLARGAVLFAGEVGDSLVDAAGLESGHPDANWCGYLSARHPDTLVHEIDEECARARGWRTPQRP
jgi:hypothetical protein